MASLYVHIPFCERKCVYCSFYSIESFTNKDRFLAALLKEIELSPYSGSPLFKKTQSNPHSGSLLFEKNQPNFPPAPLFEKEGGWGGVQSIFLGGGTPSILSPDEIDAILTKLRTKFPVVDGAEVTMECNPGALEPDWLAGYRDAGINRLSFGVQSFHDDDLQFLSRIHTSAQAEENIRLVRKVFDNVSLDLIFALPGQTLERWRHNLERAVALGTDHISAYALIFEEGTPLNAMRLKGRVSPASIDLEADMYEETVRFLESHGLRQYETSNYAKPGHECRHNIGYWERRTYISFGPSAHSFARQGVLGERWANVSSLNAYLEAIESDRSPIASRETLTPELGMEEIVMLGLRCGGIDLRDFREAIGGELTALASEPVEYMLREGFAEKNETRLRLTAKGTIFADRFALEIIDATERSLQPSSP